MNVVWNKQVEASRMWRSDRRLYLNEERTAVVDGSDPTARVLLVAEGGEIEDAVARQFGLLPPLETAEPDDINRVPQWMRPVDRASMAAQEPVDDDAPGNRVPELEAAPPTRAPESRPEPEGGSAFTRAESVKEEPVAEHDEAAAPQGDGGPDEPVVMEEQQQEAAAGKAHPPVADKAVHQARNK